MKALFASAVLMAALLFTQCRKGRCDCLPPPVAGGKYKLTYGDSVFYLKKNDYTITPLLNGGPGTYTAFPDNLQINKTTGAVTIAEKGKDGESQTGMWYKIRFKSSTSSLTDSTLILLSGLTYIDKFYRLSQNDSIIYPIYNADPSNPIPPGNYNLTSDNKFAINAANGQINVKECMRRGFFNSGSSTQNSSWKIATVKYAINDNSQGVENRIDVVLYYYHSMNEVPSNVSALMQAHQQLTVGLRGLPVIPTTTGAFDNNLPSSLSLSKPRPPCVIIVGN